MIAYQMALKDLEIDTRSSATKSDLVTSATKAEGRKVDKGTILIDLWEAKTKQQVYWVTIRDLLTVDASENARRIRRNADKIFDGLPEVKR